MTQPAHNAPAKQDGGPTSGPDRGDAAWMAVATLLRPQGRHGELLAQPLTDLMDIFSPGRAVLLAAAGSLPKPESAARHLEGYWLPTGKNAGRIVLKLSGCESIGEAEALAGQQVLVAATEMPALDTDTFFVGDLLGCAFFDGETQVGTVVDVEFPTGPDGRKRLEDAAPLLAVELAAGKEPVLVPFVRAWLESVDIAAKRVVMHLPAGLLNEDDGDEAESDGDEEDDA